VAATETPRAQQVALTRMAERMNELEAEVAELRASIAQRMKAATNDKPKATPKGKARWLESARYANACQGAGCNGRVEKGERCWYVPGVGVYHPPCAPAGARP
jgi:hypothetical protein